jgi:hypothetical protein
MNIYVASLEQEGDRFADPVLIGAFSSEADARKACQDTEDDDDFGQVSLHWGGPITPGVRYTYADIPEGRYVIQLTILDLRASGLAPASFTEQETAS